jgi:glutamate racemase
MMEEAKQHPIGIFDSGVGGLTVLKTLRKELPGRDFLYVGDTARVPYGRKPRQMVEQFAWEITGFLMDRGADAVVIACNTASAASLPRLADQMPVPIWGVVDPGVSAACKLTRTGHVGVIGTRGTIDSGAYQDRLRARGLDVWAQACPLFVHLVEEGLAESEEAELLAHHYLDARPPIDALILGCTHYPLLENVIRRVVGDETAIVSSAEAVAMMVRETLGAAPVGPGHPPGSVTHYVTGDIASYQHTALRIGGVEGNFIKVDTFAAAAVADPASH